MKTILNKMNHWFMVLGASTVALLASNSSYAISVEAFKTNIDSSTTAFGAVITYVAWFIAALLILLAGWNIYKKSKNPNGNEGAMILGSIIAAVVLLGGVELAGLGTDAVFATDNSDNLRGFSND